MLDTGHDLLVDPARRDPAAPAPLLPDATALAAGLERVESRLIALAGGDPAIESDLRRWFAESCAGFATASVRQFVPILVEREVRARLRAAEHPGEGPRSPAEHRTA